MKTAVLDPLEGISESEIAAGRRLLLGHAGEPRDPAEGARMHELSNPSSSSTASRSGTGPGVRVLEDVSLAVAPGEFVAIAGPNGGGKTTLLRLVLGLERPSEGTVRVFGKPAGKGGDGGRIGYLPQRSRLLGEAPVTVREIVSTGRLAPVGHLGAAAAGRPRCRRARDRDASGSATGPMRRCGRSRAGCSSGR